MSSRAATVSDTQQIAPSSPRGGVRDFGANKGGGGGADGRQTSGVAVATGNAQHQEAVRMLETSPVYVRSIAGKEQSRQLIAIAADLVVARAEREAELEAQLEEKLRKETEARDAADVAAAASVRVEDEAHSQDKADGSVNTFLLGDTPTGSSGFLSEGGTPIAPSESPSTPAGGANADESTIQGRSRAASGGFLSKMKNSIFGNKDTNPATAGGGEGSSARKPNNYSLYRSRVLLCGDSGVGKSSLKSCIVTTEVIKTLPDVSPSLGSGASTYYYSNNKREKLDIYFVDSGPLEIRTGTPQHLYSSDSVILLVVNLSFVKQRVGKKAKAGEEAVFLHPKDQQVIHSYLHAFAASAPGSSIVLVGTHLDVMSDPTPAGVELVLRYLSDLINKELAVIHDALADFGVLRLLTSFAVSCNSRQCISENRGGPSTIAQMWEFVCELVLKNAKLSCNMGRPFGAGILPSSTAPVAAQEKPPNSAASLDASQRSLVGQAPPDGSSVTPPDGNLSSPAFARFQGPNSLHAFRGTDADAAQQVDGNPVKVAALYKEVVEGLLHKLKHELNIPVVGLHAFNQAMYVLGVHQKELRVSFLQALKDLGEVTVLDADPGNPLREDDLLLLHPHLLSRVPSITVLYNNWISYLQSTRGKMLPGLDIAACDNADAERHLSGGYPKPRLLVELSASLRRIKRRYDERSDLFLLLLVYSDFAFCYDAENPRTLIPRMCFSSEDEEDDDLKLSESQSSVSSRRSGSPADDYVNPSVTSDPTSASANGSRRKTRISKQKDRKARPLYVIPSMLPYSLSPKGLALLAKHISAGGTMSIGRRIVFAVPVPSLLECFLCRLGKLQVSGHSVGKDGCWLRPPGGELDSAVCRILVLHRTFTSAGATRAEPFIDIIVVTSSDSLDPFHTVLNGAALVHECFTQLLQAKFQGASPVMLPIRPNTFMESIFSEDSERLEALHREPTAEEWSVVHQGTGELAGHASSWPSALDATFENRCHNPYGR